MTEQTFTEAPASVSIKAISPGGYDTMVTIRDADTAQLMERTLGALDWLAAKGFTPTARAKASNGNGGNGASGAPVCQFHGAMKRSKKFDGWYCPSKMGDGSYCQEQVKDS